MNYDSVFDKWHEECGVFGIYDRTVDVARYVYWGVILLSNIVVKKVRALLLPMVMECRTEKKAWAC